MTLLAWTTAPVARITTGGDLGHNNHAGQETGRRYIALPDRHLESDVVIVCGWLVEVVELHFMSSASAVVSSTVALTGAASSVAYFAKAASVFGPRSQGGTCDKTSLVPSGR